jgi:hypothetical protein
MPATLSPSTANGSTPYVSEALVPCGGNTQEPSHTASQSNDEKKVFSWQEFLLGSLCVLCWVVLIDFGFLVKSSDYRDNLAHMQGHGAGYWAGNGVMVLLSYTISNVALLCCLCGLLGAIADRSDIDGDAHENGIWRTIIQKYASAILRGFFIFLVLMSGLILLAGADLSVTSPIGYGHMAGTASLFSFLVGLDAHLYAKFVKRVYDKSLGNAKHASVSAPKTIDVHMQETKADGTIRKQDTHATIGEETSISSISLGSDREQMPS